jgi:hypothetical protein
MAYICAGPARYVRVEAFPYAGKGPAGQQPGSVSGSQERRTGGHGERESRSEWITVGRNEAGL